MTAFILSCVLHFLFSFQMWLAFPVCSHQKMPYICGRFSGLSEPTFLRTLLGWVEIDNMRGKHWVFNCKLF